MSSTRIHDLSDSPPRSSSFGSLVRLTREPPSPAQSEPSSRISSKRSSRNFEEEELEESKPKAAKMGEVTPPASPTTERKKKPLTRVLAFIKHLPAKVLG